MILGINTKKFFAGLAGALLFFLIAVPFFTKADTSVPSGTGISYECVQKGAGPNGTDVYGNCTFADLIVGTKKVVDFGVKFALFFSVIVIAYAGFNYMISGDIPSKRQEANKMLRKVAIGIVFILCAWLIVTLILNALGVNNIVKLG